MAVVVRLNWLLLALVMGSAFYLVHTQYESRRLYTQLDRAQTQARRLEADHEQLVVQKRAQATSARIQSIAMTKLEMRAVNPAITFYVGAVASAPVQVPPPERAP